jgi:cell division protein FtsL
MASRLCYNNPPRLAANLDTANLDAANLDKEFFMNRKKYTRNEKIMYILSILIIFSMVISMLYVAITPK